MSRVAAPGSGPLTDLTPETSEKPLTPVGMSFYVVNLKTTE